LTSEDYTWRFAGKADSYSKYRPSYPERVLSVLKEKTSFDSSKIVADVGSGTGILSRLFLENGNTVYAIEPNEDMRSKAELALARFPNFHSVKGSAEDTTLEERSVDLITVAQALHWFDPASPGRNLEES
jgi:ubiquinone/menaquinone biosynthesis C-methylase UbiE